jgi:hypothetical protein
MIQQMGEQSKPRQNLTCSFTSPLSLSDQVLEELASTIQKYMPPPLTHTTPTWVSLPNVADSRYAEEYAFAYAEL